MLFKNEVGERVQAEIPVFEREVRQPLHIVTTQPPEVVQTGWASKSAASLSLMHDQCLGDNKQTSGWAC